MNSHLKENVILNVIIVITGILLGFTAGTLSSTQHRLEAQQVCDRAHASHENTAFATCATVQDKYRLEYLCNSSSANATCWVEKRK